MYRTFIDERVEKTLQSFTKPDRARIDRVRELFEEEGFALSELYLKKIAGSIWELRAGSIRLLFGAMKKEAIIVNAFRKKTAKTPSREIRLAEKRFKDHL